MNRRPSAGAVLFFVLLVAAVVGYGAYNLGVSRGLEVAAVTAAATAPAGATAAPVPPYAYWYGWHRPWGWGFPFFPLVILFFWFMAARLLFRGGGCGRYRGGDGPDGVPRSFDEWHRRAHDQMKSGPTTV